MSSFTPICQNTQGPIEECTTQGSRKLGEIADDFKLDKNWASKNLKKIIFEDTLEKKTTFAIWKFKFYISITNFCVLQVDVIIFSIWNRDRDTIFEIV